MEIQLPLFEVDFKIKWPHHNMVTVRTMVPVTEKSQVPDKFRLSEFTNTEK